MCTVMVVDNRISTRSWLEECIKYSNIKADKIVMCKSNDEAINYIGQNNVDIAITRLQKEDSDCVELVRTMKKNLSFCIVFGYGICKDFEFLCNALNNGVSKYLKDIFDKDKLEEFLNETYERYCMNKLRSKQIKKVVFEKPEIAYSNRMLEEWVTEYSRNAVKGAYRVVDDYIKILSGVMESQNLNHSKSMMLEIMIILNQMLIKGEFKSNFTMLNFKECCLMMNVETVDELKSELSTYMKKLAKNIYLLTSASDQKSLYIIAATNFIKNNYQKDISRDDVAETVNLNPSYFSKFFKEQMDESFVAYLRRIRIETAVLHLENSKDSVKEISTKVGYIDSKYFSKLFFNHMGYTPCEYRNCITKLMA